jgi:fructose-1,6-bisphosphatase II
MIGLGGEKMIPEITLDMVRVTEAAALFSSVFLGRGDKETVDQRAVDAMRGILDLLDMRGTVVIGEGEKDQAPMLAAGERVGKWADNDPEVLIAVDPVDGTRLVANGRSNALSVIAATEKGKIAPLPTYYVHKLAVGKELAGNLDINATPRENLRIAAAILGVKVSELTVTVLDRERNYALVEAIRNVGARIKFINDGDIAAAIATALPDGGTEIYMGIGGSPEAVLAAAALECLGGEIQVKCWLRDNSEIEKIENSEFELEKVYWTRDLIDGEEVIFSATGITDGSFLKGVRFTHNKAITDSISMRSSTRTVRRIQAYHEIAYKTVTTKSGGEVYLFNSLVGKRR